MSYPEQMVRKYQMKLLGAQASSLSETASSTPGVYVDWVVLRTRIASSVKAFLLSFLHIFIDLRSDLPLKDFSGFHSLVKALTTHSQGPMDLALFMCGVYATIWLMPVSLTHL